LVVYNKLDQRQKSSHFLAPKVYEHSETTSLNFSVDLVSGILICSVHLDVKGKLLEVFFALPAADAT
jgi:hypothetical protein